MKLSLQYPELIQKLVVVDISPNADLNTQSLGVFIKYMRAIDLSKIKKRSEVDELLRENVPVNESTQLSQILGIWIKAVFTHQFVACRGQRISVETEFRCNRRGTSKTLSNRSRTWKIVPRSITLCLRFFVQLCEASSLSYH